MEKGANVVVRGKLVELKLNGRSDIVMTVKLEDTSWADGWKKALVATMKRRKPVVSVTVE